MCANSFFFLFKFAVHMFFFRSKPTHAQIYQTKSNIYSFRHKQAVVLHAPNHFSVFFPDETEYEYSGSEEEEEENDSGEPR